MTTILAIAAFAALVVAFVLAWAGQKFIEGKP